MKKSPLALILVLSALFLVACGPVVMIPGVRLGGTDISMPTSWDGIEVPEEVLLETQGGLLPRVHRIWAASGEGGILVAGEPGTGWVERALADPNIRLRMGDDVYSLRAERLDDLPALRRATDTFVAKYREGMLELYGEVPDPEKMAGEAVLFRLVRR